MREAIAVELPVLTEHVQDAVELLGGEETLKKCVSSDDGQLAVQFSESPFEHPLISSALPVNYMVIDVPEHALAHGETSVETVIRKSLRFRSMNCCWRRR